MMICEKYNVCVSASGNDIVVSPDEFALDFGFETDVMGAVRELESQGFVTKQIQNCGQVIMAEGE